MPLRNNQVEGYGIKCESYEIRGEFTKVETIQIPLLLDDKASRL